MLDEKRELQPFSQLDVEMLAYYIIVMPNAIMIVCLSLQCEHSMY